VSGVVRDATTVPEYDDAEVRHPSGDLIRDVAADVAVVVQREGGTGATVVVRPTRLGPCCR
jgi:hypothetical protein